MPTSTDAQTHVLPATLDHEGVRDLAEFVARYRSDAVRIDATNVDQVGVLAAQILTVAARRHGADGPMVHVVDPNGVVGRCLDRLGLASELSGALILEGAEE